MSEGRGLTRLALLLAPVLSCGGGPPSGPARPDPSLAVPNRVVVLPGTLEFGALGDGAALAARVLDQHGFAMEGEPVAWSVDDSTVARVEAAASRGAVRATAVGNGSATVMATAGRASGTAAVTVSQRAVRVEAPRAPDTLRILGDTVRVTMRAADANGHAAPASALAWAPSDSAVAVVDGEGVVTATGNGSATISAAAALDTAAVGVAVDNREEEDRKALLALYRAVGPGRLSGRWDPAR